MTVHRQSFLFPVIHLWVHLVSRRDDPVHKDFLRERAKSHMNPVLITGKEITFLSRYTKSVSCSFGWNFGFERFH